MRQKRKTGAVQLFTPEGTASPKLIAGNWKMNGRLPAALAEFDRLLRLAAGLPQRKGKGAKADHVHPEVQPPEILVCPPAVLLAPMHAAVAAAQGSRIVLGAQDCHPAEAGAHTGDLSAEMLHDAGARYVIIGHSERRADHDEKGALIAAKLAAAHRAGLMPILCVGETLQQREAGQAPAVVARQVRAVLDRSCTPANTVIAYEPVWAIGTGRTPTIADIAVMHAAIRSSAEKAAGSPLFRILYGGSVKPGNAVELLSVTGVDGALVGGASLVAADFWAIAAAVANPR